MRGDSNKLCQAAISLPSTLNPQPVPLNLPTFTPHPKPLTLHTAPMLGSYLRLIDSCITQLKAQGPSRTCNESKEEGDTTPMLSPHSSASRTLNTSQSANLQPSTLKPQPSTLNPQPEPLNPSTSTPHPQPLTLGR